MEDEVNERTRTSLGLMQAVKRTYINAFSGGVIVVAVALKKS